MAGKGGNLNPTGRNHLSPRPAGSIYHVTMDNSETRKLLRGLGEQAKRADSAIRLAHEEFAKELQFYQGQSLLRSITGHGRMQRKRDVLQGSLYKALTGPKNRKVNIDGWTVGFMGEQSRVGAVAKYATIQEKGTTQFVGRIMYGWWLTRAGERVGPMKGGKDAVGFEFYNFYGQQGQHSWRIENAIEGYHYQTKGFQNFKDAGGRGLGRRALEIYQAAFYEKHLDFELTMRGATGRKGYVRDVSFTKSF